MFNNRMLLQVCVCFLVFCFGKSFGVIYHLNETEYDRMPRLFELENYERCMEDPGGVYCVANAELYADTENVLYTLIQKYSEHTLKHYNYTKIDRGVCVTQTCKTFAKNAGLDINRDLRTVLEGCLNETLVKQYDLNARITKLSCVSERNKDQLNLDYLDYMFAGVFIILITLTLVGSICENYLNDKNNEHNHKKGFSGKDFLLCFSIPRNYKSLTTGESDPRVDDFKSIHAFRTIVTFFTVYAHVMFTIASGFSSDPHSFEKAYESPVQRISFSGTNIVQVLFCISGILLAYLMQVAAETQHVTWMLIPKLIFLRWWRLTPAAAMVAFSATWMRHLGSGPLWHVFISDGTSAQCRRYFWAHILYYNNYVPEDTLCTIPTWYIATDMQLFIAGVIIHLVIRNLSTRFKIITLSGLLLLSMASPAYLNVWWLDLDAFALQTPAGFFLTLGGDNFRRLHVLAHNNLSAFIVGMATGYLVYYLQQNKIEYPKFKECLRLSWSGRAGLCRAG